MSQFRARLKARMKLTFASIIDDSCPDMFDDIAPPVMKGITQITDHIYISNLTDASNIDLLLKHNIKLVVALLVETHRTGEYYSQHGIDFEHYRIADFGDADILELFGNGGVLDKIHAYVSSGQHVLVHCQEGRSRSPSVVAGYLIKYQRMTDTAALELIRQKRPYADPHGGFLAQLEDYAGILGVE